MADMEQILKAEEMFWHQKAKCKWLKEGYENMRFFHKIANRRKRKNMISSLVMDGEEVMNFETIAYEAIFLYDKLYKDPIECPSIDNLFNTQLPSDLALELEKAF